MPWNLETRKTLRSMNLDELLEFRLKQVGVQQAMEVKKGKQCAVNPPDAGEAEGSGQSPSPLAAHSGLNTLSLNSLNQSPAATTPESPVTSLQPPLPKQIASAPPAAPKRGHSHPPKSSAGKHALSLLQQLPLTLHAPQLRHQGPQTFSSPHFGPSTPAVTYHRRVILKAMWTGLPHWNVSWGHWRMARETWWNW